MSGQTFDSFSDFGKHWRQQNPSGDAEQGHDPPQKKNVTLEECVQRYLTAEELRLIGYDPAWDDIIPYWRVEEDIKKHVAKKMNRDPDSIREIPFEEIEEIAQQGGWNRNELLGRGQQVFSYIADKIIENSSYLDLSKAGYGDRYPA